MKLDYTIGKKSAYIKALSLIIPPAEKFPILFGDSDLPVLSGSVVYEMIMI